MARLEFYLGDAEKYQAAVDDAAVPRAGEYVNIKGQTFVVERVTWAVDHADEVMTRRALRANIELLVP